jgi:hypothetical protein
MSNDEASIRERAYFLWLEEAQPDGRDVDHWLQACAESQGREAEPETP